MNLWYWIQANGYHGVRSVGTGNRFLSVGTGNRFYLLTLSLTTQECSFCEVNLVVVICMSVCMLSHFSHVQLFVTPQTVAHQAPQSMGFSRQVYWNGLPCPSPRGVPNPGIEPTSLVAPALQLKSFTTELPGKPQLFVYLHVYKSLMSY